MGIEGETVEEKAKNFVVRAKEDPQWAAATIWSYLQRQKERAERGEISYSTLPNYWKPPKLLCEMNDVAINWKRITRGLPRGRKYGLDRAPTKDERKTLFLRISHLLLYDSSVSDRNTASLSCFPLIK